MAVVERFKHYKSQYMDCPPKKWPLLRDLNITRVNVWTVRQKKWPLLEVRLHLKQVSDHGHEKNLRL